MDNNYLDDYVGFHKISYDKKKANNWKWLEDNAEHYRNYHGSQFLRDNLHQIQVNYEYANARGGSSLDENRPNRQLFMANNQTSLDPKIKHFDILRRVLVRMWGQQQKSQLKGLVTDSSGYNQNLRKKKRLELYQEFMQQSVIAPLEQEATQKVYAKHGVQNPQDLNPDQQKQINLEIEQEIKFKKPSDLDKFMRQDYKSPSEGELQTLVDWMIKEYNLKYISDECYKDLTIAGFNGVEMDIINNRPSIRQINPEMFRYFNPNNESPFIGDGDWWISEREMSYTGFISEFITDETLFKKFKNDVLTSGSNDAVRRQIRGEIPHDVTTWLANNGNSTNPIGDIDPLTGELHIPDINTEQGQSFYRTVMNEYGSERRGSNGFDTISVSRIVFSSLDKLQYITREDKNNKGEYESFWVGENYTPDPRKDVDVKVRWVKAFYECKNSNNLYWDHKRCEFQNRSANDPFTIYSPFEGVEYSKLHNNTKRIAPINLGMPYNYEYDILKNNIERIQAQDFGNKFLIPEDAIPDKYELDEYLELAKVSPILPISLANLEYVQAAAQIFKGVDLSRNQELAAKMQQLDRIERECQEAMSFSVSAMGQAPASMTATNNQQNIIQHGYSMQDITGLHKMFEQRVLNTFANLVRNSLRENKELRGVLLSDMGQAELKLSPDTLNLSDIAVTVTNDMQEIQNSESMKNLLQPMIQNQMVTTSDVIKIQYNKNPADLINLAEKAEKKLEAQQEQQQQMAQQQQKEMAALQEKRLAMEEKYKELDYQLRKMEIEKTFDVDDNNRSDLLDVADANNRSKEALKILELNSKEKIEQAKLENSSEILKDNDKNRELKKKELDIKKEIEIKKINNISKKQN